MTRRLVSYFRQPVSGFSHFIAAILALCGLLWMIAQTEGQRTHWGLVSALVFGISMFLLYLTSSLYHLLPLSERGVKILRRFDHAMIYIFIAGSYTPICLGVLKPGWTAPSILTVWGLAAAGVTIKFLYFEKSRWLRIGMYLLMSWLCLILLPQICQALPLSALGWLGLSGLAYTLGAILYALKRPNPFPNVFGFHEIWHLFVMAGSFCHFWLLKEYVLPLFS